MFSLSVKSVYGLTAVVELANRFNEGPIQIRELAETHDIPQHYLEQLLVQLKKNKIVQSIRGNQGGYMLAQAPEKIPVFSVLVALEGELVIVQPSTSRNYLDFFWSGLEKTIAGELDLTLRDLIDRRQELDQAITYHI